ncbi:DUF3263 domain-containing protein [Micromonospora sp. NPDC049048]|uniref:DUF3263 domain-containing protein n=1 Tax=Micromonospora sp. NPDC049048 TaxID=3364263 RepID=UPI0037117F4B
MQPADAAPAAIEPPAPAGPGAPAGSSAADESDAAAATGGERGDAGVVPQPRTAPVAGARAVPHPRTAAEPDTAVAAPDDALPGDDADSDYDTDPGPDPGAGSAAVVPPHGALTEREQGILAFEQQWWRHAGAKEQAIRDTFGLSATRYYQLLNALLDNPAALAAEPVLVGRLRRLRSSRARNRRR